MNAARAAGLAQRQLERLRRDAVSHSQLGVVLGHDPRRGAAAEDQAVDQAGVRVALEHHRLPGGHERQTQRMVALGRAVGQEPRSLRAIGLRGEQLGALVRRRRRARVDALDVLRDVEQQSVVADRRAQTGIRALSALVAGHVEAGRAAEAVRGDRLQIRRGRLRGRLPGRSTTWRPSAGTRGRTRRGHRRARGSCRPSRDRCDGP